MSSNLVGGERFKTKFQFHPGIHPFGTPASMAGALVEMSYNEAVIAQAKGWGVVVQGRRPHHARPHLLDKNAPIPRGEWEDVLNAKEGPGNGVKGGLGYVASSSSSGMKPAGGGSRRNSSGSSQGSQSGSQSSSRRGSNDSLNSNGVNSVWNIPDSELPTHKLIVHLPGGKTAEADRNSFKNNNSEGPEHRVGQHCVDPPSDAGSNAGSEAAKSASSLGELRPEEAAEAFVLSALAGDTPPQSDSERQQGNQQQHHQQGGSAPNDPNASPNTPPTTNPAPPNPFLAAREANDTIGGLVHAREVFRRRVARNAAIENTSDKKVMKLSDRGDLYIGDVSNGKPHGEGVMMLYAYPPAGQVGSEDVVYPPPGQAPPPSATGPPKPIVTQHIGTFDAGRAHGHGTVLKSDGSVFCGEFDQNKRVGEFHALDAKGGNWFEKYNPENGKKTARKRIVSTDAGVLSPGGGASSGQQQSDGVNNEGTNERTNKGTTAAADKPQPSAGAAPASIPALRCRTCNQLFHDIYNHSFACRSHVANFVADDGNPMMGIWSCCGARSALDPGCKFGRHEVLQTQIVLDGAAPIGGAPIEGSG